MKKPEILFRHFNSSGPLSIYWNPGPYGDAIESKNGQGVGWFSSDGKLLGVEFDNVTYDCDQQLLSFEKGIIIQITTRKGKVYFTLKKKHRSSKSKKQVA